MSPNPATVAAMAAERMIVACYEHPTNESGVYAIDPDTAAEVADRLIAEAVAAERQRILDAIDNCGPLGSWDDEKRIRATLRRIVNTEVTRD